MRAAYVLLALLVASPSEAETHHYGAFSAAEGRAPKGSRCTLTMDYAPRGSWFSMSIVQDTGQMSVALYITGIERLRGKAVSVRIDDQELIHFQPRKARGSSKVLIGVHVEPDDDRLVQLLETVSDAQNVEVEAGSLHWSVPVDGLQQAASDYLACRHRRWL